MSNRNPFQLLKKRREMVNRRELRSIIASKELELAVDLGCGPSPRNKYRAQRVIGFDRDSNPSSGVQALDLSCERLPLADGAANLVTAFDVLEHIPRWERRGGRVVYPFIDLMNEIYRVLTPGGFFYSETPAYPHSEAFQDPTHINILTERTLPDYFCAPKNWAGSYGFEGSFTMLRQFWRRGHLIALLTRK